MKIKSPNAILTLHIRPVPLSRFAFTDPIFPVKVLEECNFALLWLRMKKRDACWIDGALPMLRNELDSICCYIFLPKYKCLRKAKNSLK